MDEYKKFIAIWELIRTLNVNKIWDWGTAETENGEIKITFENDKQKAKYQSIFE